MKLTHPPGLSTFIGIYAGVSLALFALVAGAFMQQGLAHLQEKALIDKAGTVSSYLSLIFREPVRTGQLDLLGRYATDLVKEYDLRYVRIAGANGEVLASAGNQPYASNTLVTNRDIRVNGTKLGELQLVCDRGRIDQSAREITLIVIGTFVGLVMLLFIVLSVMLRKLLVEPIQQLAKETSPFQQESSALRPSWHTPSEVFALRDILVASRNEVRAHIEGMDRANKLARSATQRLCHGQRLAAIGQMAAGLAHGLNTPLGNIVGYAQRAREQAPDGAVAERLNVIERQAVVCSEIVRNMLTAARAPGVLIEKFDLADLVRKTVNLLNPLMQDHGVELEMELPPEPVWVEADVGSIEQILFNLVNNAVQAGATHVRLEIRQARDAAILAVVDDGHGIDEANQTQIFDAFYTTKSVNSGTGLGLYMCAALAKNSNGSIALVESRPGHTRMELTLKAGGPT
jgi:signal transduction histidine kinase